MDVYALTDHDTVAGVPEAFDAASNQLKVISGVEISTQWRDYNIHIVGLNVDIENSVLINGLKQQQHSREIRYEKLMGKLKEDSIEDKKGTIKEFAGDTVPGRPHFARYLVENQYCESYAQAYKKLSSGGEYYVNPGWEYMSYAVNWIVKSGGIAILAHPDKYGMGKSGLKAFLRDFTNAGGLGIEVCYGAGSKAAMSKAAHLAKEYNLYGSTGSDFHRPGAPGIELGKVTDLPKNVKPIWDVFNA